MTYENIGKETEQVEFKKSTALRSSSTDTVVTVGDGAIVGMARMALI